MENLYKTLGINKNSTAEEIKKAYRDLATKHHPDKSGEDEKFKEVSHAYMVLKDPIKRKHYDDIGEESRIINSPAAKACEILTGCISSFISERKPDNIDEMVPAIKDFINGEVQKVNATIAAIKSEIKLNEKLKKNLKTKTKKYQNIILNTINVKIDLMEKQLRAIEEENYKQTAAIMINILDNYEISEPDVENQFAFHINNMMPTATTGGW